MNPFEIIYQNFPHCEDWRDDSFLGSLHENCKIDKTEYWRLEWALVSAANDGPGHNVQLHWPVFRIFSLVLSLLKSNVDPHDGYTISDMGGFSEQELTERIQVVFEGFFKGVAPDLASCFEESNPLLQNPASTRQ